MAVRLNASGEYLHRSTNLLDWNDEYTWMAWVKYNALNDWAYLQSMNEDGSYANEHVFLDDADKLNLWTEQQQGGNGAITAGTTTIVTGTWYHVALVRESSTLLKLYLDGALEATDTEEMSGRTTLDNMSFGEREASGTPDGYWSDVDVSSTKIWDVAFSLDQVNAEMHVTSPIELSDIHAWYPHHAGATERLMDYSGNGDDWTGNGTLTDVDGPPVGWGSPVVLVGAAAGGQSITPDSISSATTIYSPTVTPGVVTVTPGTIASITTVYDPTVELGGETQGITPDAISSITALYDPTVAPGAVTIAPDAVASITTLYEPTIGAGAVTIAPDAIASITTLHEPTLTPGSVAIAPDAIASITTVYEPTVSTDAVIIAPDTIASITTVYEPTLTPGTVEIAPDTIASITTVYDPTVTAEGGPQSVTPDAIASITTIYDPTLTPGSVAIAPDAVSSITAVYEPTLGLIIALDAISSITTLYGPTLTPGSIAIVPDAIASITTVYGPIVSNGADQGIVPDAIASITTIHAVTIWAIALARIRYIDAENRTRTIPAEVRTRTIT